MTVGVGIVSIVWLGQNLKIQKGAKLMPGGLTANPVDYNTGFVTANEWKHGEVTATIVLTQGQSLLNLRNGGRPGELQFNTDSGQQWIEAAAVITNQPSVTGGDGGKVDLKWTIGEPTELLAS